MLIGTSILKNIALTIHHFGPLGQNFPAFGLDAPSTSAPNFSFLPQRELAFIFWRNTQTFTFITSTISFLAIMNSEFCLASLKLSKERLLFKCDKRYVFNHISQILNFLAPFRTTRKKVSGIPKFCFGLSGLT
jgi:hypothetical protein